MTSLMTPCWMSSLVTLVVLPSWKNSPSLAGPGSVSCWYHSQCGYRPLGPIGWGSTFPPRLSYHCVLLLTPAPCSFTGTQITCRSVPRAPFTPTPPFSPPMWPLSAPAGRRATDMQEAEWPQLFRCLCFQFSCCLCSLSWLPGSHSSSDFSSPSETALISLCWFK